MPLRICDCIINCTPLKFQETSFSSVYYFVHNLLAYGIEAKVGHKIKVSPVEELGTRLYINVDEIEVK